MVKKNISISHIKNNGDVMQKTMYKKDSSDPTELDILIAQIKAKDHKITDTFVVDHQVPFRIFQWNY